MLKKVLYIFILLGLLYACQSKKVVVTLSIPDIETQFSEKEIRLAIDSIIELENDSLLADLYIKNDCKPVWKSDSLLALGIDWIEESKFQGLDPEDYRYSQLDSCYNSLMADSILNPEKYAKLDILLTSSVKKCGREIRFSKYDPKNFHSGWNFPSPKNLPNDSVWIAYIKQGKIENLNQFYEPKHELYSYLKIELAKYMSKDRSCTENKIVNPGFLLQKGDSNKYVLPLKHKLLHVPSDSSISMAFDDELKNAVLNFQKKHGLQDDGVVGNHTYYFLNWNKLRYLDAIKINMERLRWLPDSALTHGVVVNIAAQRAYLYHRDSLLLTSKIVVGKSRNKTRVFQSDMKYMVFNPCWTVPRSIASTSILHGLKKDSLYLQKRNMFLQLNGKNVIADSIDFSVYSSTDFPYQVFQNTDPANALGKVKFMFKNKYNIYMHDTPIKSTFRKNYRAFSHGCLRLQDAEIWADVILQQINSQTFPIQNYLNKGYPIRVNLNKNIPVSILYLTCWIEDEQLVFGKDIYGLDYKLLIDMEE